MRNTSLLVNSYLWMNMTFEYIQIVTECMCFKDISYNLFGEQYNMFKLM